MAGPVSVNGPTRLRRDPVLGQIVLDARVEALIKAGKTARTYAAYAVSTGAPVTLKMLRPVLRADLDQQRAFAREQSLLGSLLHPGIPRYLAGGYVQGVPCYVVEAAQGRPLGSLPQRVALDERRAALVMWGLCSALDQLHRAGFAHHALSGEEVLVSDGLERVMLRDVGSAKKIASVDDVERDLVAVGQLFASLLGEVGPALRATLHKCSCVDPSYRYFAVSEIAGDLRAVLTTNNGSSAPPPASRTRGIYAAVESHVGLATGTGGRPPTSQPDFDIDDEITEVRSA